MAITWRENYQGFVPVADWLETGFTVTRQNDPIDGLFADQKTANLVAEWQTIAAEYQVPFMAQFHGFDTEANTTFRVPVDTHNIEKGLIKVKMNQSERMRELIRAGVHGDEAIYDYVINDGLRLADGVVTRTKVAKNELMATGKVTIKENDLDVTVDYGVPAKNTDFVITFGATDDVPAQIQAVVDAARENGTSITGILTSNKMLSKMRSHPSIQKVINGVNAVGVNVRNSALRDYLADEFGITTVITNDLTYTADAVIGADGRPVVTTKRYFPENKVSFFAANVNGRMGVGLWGDPPEADAADFKEVGGSSVNPYVYLMQWMENDPTVLWTKASALFMPVLFNPSSLYIATASDGFFDPLTIQKESQGTSMWGVPVSSMQADDVVISNGAVTGTLKKLTGSNAITDVWGEGYFINLKWSDPDAKANSLKVGVEPTEGSGLQECYTDTDRNGVFKITNKNIQHLVFVQSNGNHATVQTLDVSGLTLSDS